MIIITTTEASIFMQSNYTFIPDVAGLMLDECYSFKKEKLLVEFKLLRTGGQRYKQYLQFQSVDSVH